MALDWDSVPAALLGSSSCLYIADDDSLSEASLAEKVRTVHQQEGPQESDYQALDFLPPLSMSSLLFVDSTANAQQSALHHFADQLGSHGGPCGSPDSDSDSFSHFKSMGMSSSSHSLATQPPAVAAAAHSPSPSPSPSSSVTLVHAQAASKRSCNHLSVSNSDTTTALPMCNRPSTTSAAAKLPALSASVNLPALSAYVNLALPRAASITATALPPPPVEPEAKRRRIATKNHTVAVLVSLPTKPAPTKLVPMAAPPKSTPPACKPAAPKPAAALYRSSKCTCLNCGATNTPQWRHGPDGPRTLCNACGVRHSKGHPLAYIQAREQ